MISGLQGPIDSLAIQARSIAKQIEKETKKGIIKDLNLADESTKTKAAKFTGNLNQRYMDALGKIEGKSLKGNEGPLFLTPIGGNLEALTKSLWTATVGEFYNIKGAKALKKSAESILAKYQNAKIEGYGSLRIPYMKEFSAKNHKVEEAGIDLFDYGPELEKKFKNKVVIIQGLYGDKGIPIVIPVFEG